MYERATARRHVGQRSFPVPTRDHAEAAVLPSRIVQGEPAGTQGFLRGVRRRNGAVGRLVAVAARGLGTSGDEPLHRHDLRRRHPAQAVDRPRAARLPDDAIADLDDSGRRRRLATPVDQAAVPQLDLLGRLPLPGDHPRRRRGRHPLVCMSHHSLRRHRRRHRDPRPGTQGNRRPGLHLRLGSGHDHPGDGLGGAGPQRW